MRFLVSSAGVNGKNGKSDSDHERYVLPQSRNFPGARHSRKLLSGIQVEFGLDPRLKHSGVTPLGVASLSPDPQFSKEMSKFTEVFQNGGSLTEKKEKAKCADEETIRDFCC